MPKVFDQGRRTYGLPGPEEFSDFEGLTSPGQGSDQSSGSLPDPEPARESSREAAVVRLLHALADEQMALARLMHLVADTLDPAGESTVPPSTVEEALAYQGSLRDSLQSIAGAENALLRKLKAIQAL